MELSDRRHLSEYQIAKIKSAIRNYRGTHALILSGPGEHTQSYALELYNLLHSERWNVSYPTVLPGFYDSLTDVQVSIAGSYWATDASKSTPSPGQVLAQVLADAGVKGREKPTLDPDIGRELVVLWVGVKSPDNVSPGECPPVSFKPKPKEPRPCWAVSQGTVPMVPE
jgi:hypothetical protein